MKKYIVSGLMAMLFTAAVEAVAAPRQQLLTSPDGRLKVQISNRGGLSYSLSYNDVPILKDCEISMKLEGGKSFNGKGKTLNKNAKVAPISETLTPGNYIKSEVACKFNEIRLTYKDYEVIFRAYDDGFAYRFAAFQKDPFKVVSEQAQFNFVADWPTYVTYSPTYTQGDKKGFDKQYHHTFENTYTHQMISAWAQDRIVYLPAMFEADQGIKVCITEADLMNYPGMYLQNVDKKKREITACFPTYPTASGEGGRNNQESVVSVREKYIARYDKPEKVTEFPWRVIAVAPNAAKMADNDLVYKLSAPERSDLSFGWVRPGKALWDWWSTRNLHGVSFRCGINTQTYKYYIDFASEHHLDYVVIGEGWNTGKQADLQQIISDLDLQEVVDYGKQKNVGIFLWAGFWSFSKNIEAACEHFSKMGVAGFVVDLISRDDQEMVNTMTFIAYTAAKNKLMIDFHGCCKPTGMTKTFPNVISFESVMGMEKTKVISRDVDMVANDVVIPFVRSVAGPVDYSAGAMKNATLRNYVPIYEDPMSQGTRCHQMAQHIVYYSPLGILCDSPAEYTDNKECFQFLASIPTVWNKTKILSGEVGEYVVIARNRGDEWYVGGINGWQERDVTVDLAFPLGGEADIEVFMDGINADRSAKDYQHKFYTTRNTRELHIHMAPGGGFAIRVSKRAGSEPETPTRNN